MSKPEEAIASGDYKKEKFRLAQKQCEAFRVPFCFFQKILYSCSSQLESQLPISLELRHVSRFEKLMFGISVLAFVEISRDG
jgi:hypothetical protein